MREIILGTAGHVDHGKTSFIKALTGIECDRLKEEKDRGITIELGFAYLDLPCGRRLGIVDVPGHEKFIRNMVAGAAGMDLVTFIIAADEGIMPQTREHFEICRLLGLQHGLIVLTKKDLVSSEWLEMVADELRDFFRGSFLEQAPVVAVDSLSGSGIEEVKSILDQKVRALPVQEEFGPFRMPVDRVFSMKGFGTIITGTSLSGRIASGAELTLYPSGRRAKIRGIQVHGVDTPLVEAGHRSAINLQGIEKEEIKRGDIAATPETLAASQLVDAQFQYLSSASKDLKHRSLVRVHVGAREITARVSLLHHDQLAPGAQAFIQLMLTKEAAMLPGDRYVLRSYSPAITIGGGVIINNAPKKRKRTSAAERELNVALLRRYLRSEEDRILLLLQESGPQGLDAKELTRRSGLFGKRLQKVLQRPVSTGEILIVDAESQRMVHVEVAAALQEKMLSLLQAFHQRFPLKTGMAREELRSSMQPALDAKLLQHQLTLLTKKAKIEQDGAELRMVGHEVRLRADEKTMEENMSALYAQAGLSPPNMKEVLAQFAHLPAKQGQQIMELLIDRGILIRVNEQLLFHTQALQALEEQLRHFLRQHGDIDAPRFKQLTGLTRKYSIPLLEYFDRIKLTLRVGDNRVLRKG